LQQRPEFPDEDPESKSLGRKRKSGRCA
jgi:hypothetical protein